MSKQFTCKICSKSFNSYNSLRIHSSKLHKIASKTLYIDLFYNGIEPTCKCGCGGSVKFNGHGFSEYMPGHYSRVHNNWGHNPKALAKSIVTMKEKRKNGEVTVWNKGLTGEEYIKHFDKEDGSNSLMDMYKNPERNKKISETLTGRKHTKEHRENHKKSVKKYWDKQENRDAARVRRSKWMSTNQKSKKSRLEKTFESLLKAMEINYEFQYLVNGYNYDFYLKDFNILIEVDGDWYHCNPLIHKPIHEIQKHTIEHDKIKNKIAKDNGYKLIRIWEYDIKNKFDEVVSMLLQIKNSK